MTQPEQTSKPNDFSLSLLELGEIIGLLCNSSFNASLSVGLGGFVGKWTLSFFNPAIANTIDFLAFARMGAIAGPLIVIPLILKNGLIEKNSFLSEHPNLKAALNTALDLTFSAAGIAASAAILGSPISPALACTMLLPTVAHGLKLIYEIIKGVLDNQETSRNAHDAPLPDLA